MKKIVIAVFLSTIFLIPAYSYDTRDFEGGWMHRNNNTQTATYFVYARNGYYVMRIMHPDTMRRHTWGGSYRFMNDVIVMNVQGGVLRYRILEISQDGTRMRVGNMNTGNEITFGKVL